MTAWKSQVLKLLLLFWPFCVAAALLQAQVVSGFQVKTKTVYFFFPSAQKEFNLGTVSFTLAVRNAGMEENGFFWHDCCLASKAREAHVSSGSPFCRQLSPLCCQEMCLFVWVVILVCTLFSPFSCIPTCHPLLSVRVLSFLGKASQNCVSALGFSSKANFQELRELFVCISFPGTVRAQKKKAV